MTFCPKKYIMHECVSIEIRLQTHSNCNKNKNVHSFQVDGTVIIPKIYRVNSDMTSIDSLINHTKICCPNHKRFARKSSKISKTGKGAATQARSPIFGTRKNKMYQLTFRLLSFMVMVCQNPHPCQR